MMTADIKVTGRFDDAFATGAKPMFERLAQEARDITVDMSEAVDVNAAGLGALVEPPQAACPPGLQGARFGSKR